MRCDSCDKPLKDGDTAYEIGVKRIHIVGETVRTYHSDAYACELCITGSSRLRAIHTELTERRKARR